jgi:hypothetical protein
MKMRRRKTVSLYEIATLVITIGGFIWIGAFEISGVKHGVKEISTRLDKMEIRLDKMDEKLNNIDIRVNILEHRKP